MTPSMGMAAPKGMAAAPQAGLAAIAQPAQAPKGKSSGNMAQVMALARKMSDAQLAEVLQGKSLDVPQYVAMTEAMGRKSLRTAMDGQQAMAQAQQPSVKDKLMMGDQPQMPQGMPMAPQQPVMAADGGLMYADGGIASLSAPNMESMDMASGGIVAFNEGGLGSEFGGTVSYADDQERLARLQLEKNAKQYEFLKEASPVAAERFLANNPELMAKATPAATPAPAKVPAGGPTVDQINALNARPRAPVVPIAPKADKEKAGLGGTDEFAGYMDMVKKNNADYLSKLEGASAKQREAGDRARSQGGGEALLALSRGLLGKSTLAAGVSEGIPGVLAAAAGSRKEQNALNQSANDYELNIAKAQEAAAKGDMESALKFKQLADEAVYRKESIGIQRAQLNKPGESMQLLNALRKPGEDINDTYARMSTVKKGELYSIDKAADDFNKIAADKFSDPAKRLKALGITTPYQYQQYVLSQSGGGGIDLASQAAAILASRNK